MDTSKVTVLYARHVYLLSLNPVFLIMQVYGLSVAKGKIFTNTVEPVYNGHLGTRYIWPLYTGGCYRENLHKVVSNILVTMTVINE